MSGFLVNLLIAAAVLTHTLLGCCWHHVHPGHAAEQRVSVATGRHVCDSHQHHHAESTDRHAAHVVGHGEEEDSPHGHRHLCNEPDCMYVIGKTVRLQAPLTLAVVAVADLLKCDSVRFVLAGEVAESGTTESTAPELRAALQVWLI